MGRAPFGWITGTLGAIGTGTDRTQRARILLRGGECERSPAQVCRDNGHPRAGVPGPRTRVIFGGHVFLCNPSPAGGHMAQTQICRG